MKRIYHHIISLVLLSFSATTFAQIAQDLHPSDPSAEIQQIESLELTASSNIICNGHPVQLTSNLLESDEFEWTPKEAFINPESRNPWVSSKNDVVVTLTVTRNGKLLQTSLALKSESVMAEFEASPEKGSVPLLVSFKNTSQNAINYYWDFGIENSSESSPEIIFREPGTYSGMLVAVGAKGCKDTARISNLKVFEEAKFFIPTTFTPNFDGLNETFEVKSKNVAKYRCEIFNSTGEKIFTITQPGEYWDGTFNGYPAPSAPYVYRIQYTDLSGVVRKLVGSVELRR
ncbi:MAG: gliding motility-associated C-terminal domain-containing protein [Flavobacteriales bacterium]|nr:gliding motility-associated C-terminal domain-containing protein [Flavobacteriales bacterium]